MRDDDGCDDRCGKEQGGENERDAHREPRGTAPESAAVGVTNGRENRSPPGLSAQGRTGGRHQIAARPDASVGTEPFRVDAEPLRDHMTDGSNRRRAAVLSPAIRRARS